MNAHTKPPGEPQGTPLYLPTPVTPEEAFQAIGRLRKEARDEIDRLIRFLDKTDDYVSREMEDSIDDHPHDDDELEPSLCGLRVAQGNLPPDCFWHEDLEGDDTSTGRSAEDEPSLGSVGPQEWGNQENWAVGGRADLEEACEDEGAAA